MLNRYISISLRLTLWFGIIFLIGWLLFGAAMWLALKSTLKAERYQTLARRADRLQELLANDQNRPESDRVQDFRDFAHATGNGLSEIFQIDGSRTYPSPSTAAMKFPWPRLPVAAQEQFVHVTSAGQHYWVLQRPYTAAGQSLVLFVAAPETGNLIVLHNFLRGLLTAAPVLLLISCASGYWVSRRALSPVDRITAKARSISITNLSERLPVTQATDELQRLTITCNEMLTRLETAVSGIKQFTADASHELRSPLSFTRTVAEVALRDPHITDHSRQAFEEIVDESARAADLLEQMLTLARADANSYDAVCEPVDLALLVRDVCAQAESPAAQRDLTLKMNLTAQGGHVVLGDSSLLRRLLWILLDNAVKYTDPHGLIEVSLRGDDDGQRLEVRDTGVGIAPEDLPRIFDRFYRADPSRGIVEGNGLGLAIAQWIAEQHRTRLSVTSSPGGGSVFSIDFT